MASAAAVPLTSGPGPLDARRWPASSGRATRLAVLLHGYAETPARWTEFVRQVAPFVPDMEFVAPEAPNPMPNMPHGRHWWDYADRHPGAAEAGVAGAARQAAGFIVAELGRTGLPLTACILCGFSQGAMVALHAALRLPSDVAGVLSFAGRLVDRRPDGISARPPVLLVHGTQDVHVPSEESAAACRVLRGWGVAAEMRMLDGLGHAMDDRAIDLGVGFLRDPAKAAS